MFRLNQRRTMGCRLETVYFLRDPDAFTTDCDIVLFYMSNLPANGLHHGSVTYTLQLSLDVEEDALFANIRKSNRKDIREALANPDLKTEIIRQPTQEQLIRFADSYDEFARQKDISPMDRKHLMALKALKPLTLMYVNGPDGLPICGALDLYDGDFCYAAYAFTMFRSMENRRLASQANKLLYWIALLQARASGCITYDMAGIANGEKDGELAGIDDFKKGFGGQVVNEYNYFKGYTLKGRFFVAMMKWMKKELKAWD